MRCHFAALLGLNGLRDYGTGTWEGGDEGCDHIKPQADSPKDRTSTLNGRATNQNHEREPWANNKCGKCGAIRTDAQLGSEKVPDCLGWAKGVNCAEKDWKSACFVCRMVLVFRELRRVLREDGVLWLNLGDTYSGSWGNYGGQNRGSGTQREITTGSQAVQRAYKDKDQWRPPSAGNFGLRSGNLVGIPWRVALALQADGWILRQDIIWSKPSPMPESVTNRCTKSHEYLFLLAKTQEYFCNMNAIKEDSKRLPHSRSNRKTNKNRNDYDRADEIWGDGSGRNRRSVWTVSSGGGFGGLHFATFPQALIEPCILAGTPDGGSCTCGAPTKAVVKKEVVGRSPANGVGTGNVSDGKKGGGNAGYTKKQVTAHVKTCQCRHDEVRPAVVLDPFVGSGTTVLTCLELGRASIGIDLNEQYLRDYAVPVARNGRRTREAPRVKCLQVAPPREKAF